MTELRRIEFSLPPRVGHYRTRTLARFLLPNSSTSKNLFTAFLVDFGRPVLKERAARVRPNPGERAREWRRMLESGEVASRAELARQAGVSRARVTQVLGPS